jgi:DNA-binding HxlR family transcriptional regulator
MAGDKIAAAGTALRGCPLDTALNVFARKWLVHIVWLLGRNRTMRFAELRRELKGVSAKVLSARLRQLQKLAIVEREDKGLSPPHVSYRLTRGGEALDRLLLGVNQLTDKFPFPAFSAGSDNRRP